MKFYQFLHQKTSNVLRLATKPGDLCLDAGKTYVFVGLNALNECEKAVLTHMKDRGKAELCWDWTGDMARDPKNRASFFMKDNVSLFPPAFDADGRAEGVPEFNVMSVPST